MESSIGAQSAIAQAKKKPDNLANIGKNYQVGSGESFNH